MKRTKEITEDQKKYRDSILQKKRTYRKRATEIYLPEPMTRERYMNNCLYWIRLYYERKGDKESAKKAVFYLRQYCDEIIRELNSDPNPERSVATSAK